jgi:hypothetical protein
MKKDIDELPANKIITIAWKQFQLYDLFQDVEKGSLFGYSSAYKYEDIVIIASNYGVKVKLLSLKHPLRKKYGEFVLQVTSVKKLPKLDDIEPINVGFKDISSYGLGRAKGNRSCQGDKCKGQILKGTECLDIVELKEILPGKKVYNKKSYCINCANSILTFKITELTRLRKALVCNK